MANRATDYIMETLDSVFNYQENKKKKNTAQEEIEEFLDGYGVDRPVEKPQLPDAPEYERMEYDAPSDDEIKTRAENELGAYKSQSEKKIEDEMTALGEKFNSQLEDAKTRYDENTKKAEDAYGEAKRNTDSDMLKRGLARSSIAANKQAEIEQSRAAATLELGREYQKEAAALGEKINSLAAERERALSDFNIAYAAKITERIGELTAERDKKQTEALKYNNSLAEKEHSAAVDKQMKESDLYTEALSQREKEKKLAESGENNYYGKMYAAIVEKLRTINKHDARDIVLNNPRIRGAVGNTYYFYKLYDEFCR